MAMTEGGEFQKRIVKESLELTHGDMASDAEGNADDYITLGQLNAILDEAKKEIYAELHTVRFRGTKLDDIIKKWLGE